MKKRFYYFAIHFTILAFASLSLNAQTNVTDQHLTNAGFDAGFNYDAGTTGNVSGDVINNVSGWNKDMDATYTVSGTFEYGSGATFNNSSAIPDNGYLDTSKGALALTTGWGTILKYSQSVTLESGKYSLVSAYYNVGTATSGSGLLGWVPQSGDPTVSEVDEFPTGTWITDTVDFFVLDEAEGKIQIGFQSINGTGSANNAKILVDHVQLLYHGIDKTELNNKITEAEAVYDDGSGTGAEEFLTVINDAKSVAENEDASMSDVVDAINALEENIRNYRLNNASEENPLDVTHHLVNPGFESAFAGWENSGLATQTNTAFPEKKGTNYVEKWVNRGSQIPDVSIHQELTNIPNGKYTLTAGAGNIQQKASESTENAKSQPQTGVHLFAGYKTTTVDTIQDYSVEFIVFDNQVTIGLKAENATGNWLTCDNFRLKYEGRDLNTFAAFVDELITEGQSLLQETMLNTVRDELESAITQGQQATTAEPLVLDDLHAAHTTLLEANDAARISTEACIDLQTAIDKAEEAYGDGSGEDADVLNDKITEGNDLLTSLDGSPEDVVNTTSELYDAIFVFRLANGSGTEPTVVTNPNFARGATAAFGRSEISGVTMANLEEHGFCWSTEPEPTVHDNRATRYFSNNGYIYHIQNLEPSTVYYMRAYAITEDFAVGYGDEIKVITIPKGTITYQLNASVTNAEEQHHERISKAMESAVEYWNNLTGIQGKHLSVNHHPGTPTAEANYDGYIQFGAEPGYQQTGTALHEMGHCIGVGTHSMWYGPDSPLRENGSRGPWLGERANKVVQFLDNDPNAKLQGDAVHMWPYGINGAHEDDGTEFLYIANSLITQGLGEDGLPPASGFALPAHTFNNEEGEKYYIKSESETMGRDTRYLTINRSGNLVKTEMSGTEATANDSAAWYIAFNPENAYYQIRNVATGKLFSYAQSGTNGIRLEEKTNPGASENFQLMAARSNTTIGEDANTFTSKGYWIVRPENKSNPQCLSALTSGSTRTTSFNIANSATSKRWLLLTGAEALELEEAIPTSIPAGNDPTESVIFYSEPGRLHIENIPANSKVIVTDITGKKLKISDNVSDYFTCELSAGVYIVTVHNNKTAINTKVVIE